MIHPASNGESTLALPIEIKITLFQQRNSLILAEAHIELEGGKWVLECILTG
jgi:hypothetical protein